MRTITAAASITTAASASTTAATRITPTRVAEGVGSIGKTTTGTATRPGARAMRPTSCRRLARAVEGVHEGIGDPELAVDGEDQRQARRLARIDVLPEAREPSHASEAGVVLAIATAYDGRRVLEEANERVAAEALVVPCVDDELVPEIVDPQRGHGHPLATAAEIREEELPERAPRAAVP